MGSDFRPHQNLRPKQMSRLERIGFWLFMGLCFAFIIAVFIILDLIAAAELRLSQ